jgi:hypothetical protein
MTDEGRLKKAGEALMCRLNKEQITSIWLGWSR